MKSQNDRILAALNTTSANDEAMRIWTTLPVKSWKAELATLPEVKVIYGVAWPFRMSVRERLLTAYKLLSMGCAAEYLGMSASNIFSEITNQPTNGS